MTRTSRWREYPVMRLITVLVILSFASSSVSVSAAAPGVAPVTSSEEGQLPAVEQTAPPEGETPDTGIAPDESVVAPPTTSDPDPSADPEPATEAPAPAAGSGEPSPEAAAPAEPGDAPDVATDLGTNPGTDSVGGLAGIAAAQITSPAVGGGNIQVRLEGYRTSPSLGWSPGNLGSQYHEGDWVPYRMIVDNSNGDAPAVMPAFSFEYDHYASTKNAIGVDRTRSYNVSYVTEEPGADDSRVWAGASISPVSHDAPFPSGEYGSSPFLKTLFAEGVVVVPAGQYAVVYFQAHLSITAYCRGRTPARSGSGFYPGSSMQMRLDSDAGDKTVPIPIPPRPGGSVSGTKFHDHDRDGVRDAGDEGLGGWTFHLSGGPEGFPIDIAVTSASDGTFAVPNLPGATYSLDEDSMPGWQHSTSLPLAVVVRDGETTSVQVGNYRPDVTKTFSLAIDSLPLNSSAFVRYLLDEVPQTLELGSDTPLVANVNVPYGSVITNVRWYARYGTEELLLGTTAGETMTSDKTNRSSYDSAVRGAKFNDTDGDGVRDAGEVGLAGWTIVLTRGTGPGAVEYARTVTASDGAYAFLDVLPGSYGVSEVQQAGWHNTLAPTNPFAVTAGTMVSGLDFGNLFINSSIRITKNGPAAVHVGDTINYVIVVSNTGNYRLTNVMVTDALLGISRNVGSLDPSQSVSIDASHVATMLDADPLPNTALVVGTTVLGGTVSGSASHSVDIIKPAIDVVKIASSAIAADPASIVYTYRVSNIGSDTLTGVMLTDDHLTVVGASIGTLLPGQVVTLTASAVLRDDVTNIATVSGTDVLSRTVSDSASATVDVTHPAISIVKTVEATVAVVGQPVTYRYLVTNTGDTVLNLIAVTDDVFGAIDTIPTLLPGAFAVIDRVVPAVEDVTNIGMAVGRYGVPETQYYGTVSSTDDAVLNVVRPAIDLVKTVSAPHILTGGTVVYTFRATNTGDVPLSAVIISDDRLGMIGSLGTPLAVGASFEVTRSAVLTTDTVNVAVTTASDAYGHGVTDTARATVDVHNPGVDIDKTVNPTVVLAGESVVYTYRVTNTGDMDLHHLAVTDDILGAIGTIDALGVSESRVMTTSAVISVDTTNVGTVEASYGDMLDQEPVLGLSGTLKASDNAVVDVVRPAIAVIKTAAPAAILAGENVVYTYTVTNSGNVELFGVSLTDDRLGSIGSLESLLVGDSRTFTRTVALGVPTTNTVLAAGTDRFGHEVTDADDAFVDVAAPFTPPDVTIDKSADLTEASSGDLVTYTLTYRNVGAGPAYNIRIVDDFDERYVTVVNANGGAVSGGRITWGDNVAFFPADAPRTIVYTVRIDSDLPDTVTRIDNTVVISEPADMNQANDSDTWRVTVPAPFLPFTGDPFLPFTGGAAGLLGFAMLLMLAAGLVLRRLTR